jgi:toxin-antitoxin system PIN domain toxin
METSTEGRGSVLVCRVAQMGLLRLLTNPIVMKEDIVTATRAWGVLDAFLADARFRFVSEPPETEGTFRRLTASQPGSRVQWTDAYLAAFALAGGLCLVTFDRDFSRFQNLDFRIPES